MLGSPCMLRIWLLVAALLAVHACSEPSNPPPGASPAFEAEFEIAADGAISLDGVQLPGELGSAEACDALRVVARRRIGRFDERDPHSCILPLVRVQLAVDPSADFGHACRLLCFANQLGVNLWNFSLVRGDGSSARLPLTLRACPDPHNFPHPSSVERNLMVRLVASNEHHERALEPQAGWSFETWTYDAPREPKVDLDWPQVERLVVEARLRSRTSILSRTIASDAPWCDVELLLRQLDALGVDHYEFVPEG